MEHNRQAEDEAEVNETEEEMKAVAKTKRTLRMDKTTQMLKAWSL